MSPIPPKRFTTYHLYYLIVVQTVKGELHELEEVVQQGLASKGVSPEKIKEVIHSHDLEHELQAEVRHTVKGTERG